MAFPFLPGSDSHRVFLQKCSSPELTIKLCVCAREREGEGEEREGEKAIQRSGNVRRHWRAARPGKPAKRHEPLTLGSVWSHWFPSCCFKAKKSLKDWTAQPDADSQPSCQHSGRERGSHTRDRRVSAAWCSLLSKKEERRGNKKQRRGEGAWSSPAAPGGNNGCDHISVHLRRIWCQLQPPGFTRDCFREFLYLFPGLSW